MTDQEALDEWYSQYLRTHSDYPDKTEIWNAAVAWKGVQQSAEIEHLRAKCRSKDALIAEQHRLNKERQEWALHTNEVILGLRAELAALRGQEPVAWYITEKHLATTDGQWSKENECEPLFLAPQPAIPDGWQLVPKEPTPEMLTAGEREADNEEGTYETVFSAMIAAAPEPSK